MRTAPVRPSPAAVVLRTVVARAYPRVVGGNREPSWLFFSLALPLLALLALLYVYRALGAPPEYEGFVIIGGAMTAFWGNTVSSMALQFRWEKQSGNLELYMIAPTSLMSVLGGMAVGGSLATALRAVLVMALGAFAFRVPFSWDRIGWALLAALLCVAALYGLGMAAASLFLRFGRGMESALQNAQEPVFLLTGAFFPVRSLGPAAALAGSLIPLTLGLDALRQLLLPGHADALVAWQVEALLLAAYTAVTMLGAHVALEAMERSAKRAGRLTLRWQ